MPQFRRPGDGSSRDHLTAVLLPEDSGPVPLGDPPDNGNPQTGAFYHIPDSPAPDAAGPDGDGAYQRDPSAFNHLLLSSSGSHSHREFVVYSERWYILAIFCMLAAIQAWAWNTWGPIENTAIAVFGWSASDLALLANWGAITYVLSAFFFSWLIHAKGLRVSLLITLVLMVAGMGIRCLPVPSHAMLWVCHVGQFLIGLSGPFSMAGITTLSAVWFPANERTTATAIGTTMVFLGVALSFSLGTHIVGDLRPVHTNESTVSPIAFETDKIYSHDIKVYDIGDYDPADVQKGLQEIQLLLIFQFVWSVLLLLAALIYYPDAPATTPTASAAVKREDMKAGLLSIIKKKDFWMPALAYSISIGCSSSWSTQIVSIFDNHINQDTSGWIGFYSNIAGTVGCVLFGRGVDYLGGKMKAVLLALMFGSFASFMWALLLSNSYIPFSTVSLYLAITLFTFFLNSTTPLFYETTVECAFPAGEETTTMFLTWVSNIPAVLFLIPPMFPSVASQFGDWLNWMMLGSIVVCFPLLLAYKEHYNRLQFDIAHPDEEIDEEVEGSRSFQSC